MGYLTHMKTTIDIADSLMLRAKEVAAREKITLKALTEEGLEMALQQRERRKTPEVRPVVFDGGGLKPEFNGGSWDRIRDASYEGRGS